MKRKTKATFLQGGKIKSVVSMEFHTPQENRKIFHELDLQENRQQFQTKELSDKVSFHLCEDEAAVRRLSQKRIQFLAGSNLKI